MDHRGRAHERRQAGFTLIELAIVVLVVSVLVVKASEIFGASSNAQNSISVRDVLEERVRTATEKITNRLREAGNATVQGVPDFPESASSIRFHRLEAYDLMLGPQWGPEETIALVPSSRGVGMVIWSSGTLSDTLAIDVTELQFSREGRRIRFGIEATALGPLNDRITVRRNSDVTLQN